MRSSWMRSSWMRSSWMRSGVWRRGKAQAGYVSGATTYTGYSVATLSTSDLRGGGEEGRGGLWRRGGFSCGAPKGQNLRRR